MTQRTVPPGHARTPHARTPLGFPWLRGSLLLTALVATLLTGCATSGGTTGKATLAGSETTPSSTAPADPAEEPRIDPMPTGGQTPVSGRPWDAATSVACDALLDDGLTEVAQTRDPAGTTSFWSAGHRWAVCDMPGTAGAEPALFVSASGAGTGFDERALAVSSTSLPAGGAGPAPVRFAAGGRLPWPVEELAYTFPDGHTAQARFVQGGGDTWWAVTYTATDGVLVDPSTTSADLDPVTVSIVGAAAEAFRLPWEDVQRSE